MSSAHHGSSEAETQGSQSAAQAVVPSHPVEFDESDMSEASRSVSPEPLNFRKSASQHTSGAGASSKTQSGAGSSTYPEGYSADGIPPVLLTEHITPGEQGAASSSLNNSSHTAAHAGAIPDDSSSAKQPSALRDTVPSATDQGFAEPPAINTHTDKSAAESDTTHTPSSPSKSPSFFSRILGGFMGSTPEPTDTTSSRGYSNEAPSASWGRPAEPQPIEHIREAGAARAEESGLDEPTATKQAGLDAPSHAGGYQQSTPNTAVAAAESLVDNKDSAQHDTALAGQHAPHSPGHSENEYYGTPQASPDEHGSRTPGQGLHEEGHQAQPHASSEARRQLNLSDPPQGASHERALHQPFSSSQRSADNRDLDNTDSFQTARSTTSEAPNAGNTGVLGSVMETVGLSGKDYVDGTETKQTEPETTRQTGTDTSSSNTGVLGALKSAVGLGGSTTSPASYSGSRYSSERPAWATAGATQAPVRAQSPDRQAESFEERKSGQPYEQTEGLRGLSQPQVTAAAADDGQLSRLSPTKSAQADTQEHKHGQLYGESEVDQRLSGPQLTSQYIRSTPSGGNADTVQTHDHGMSTIDKLKAAVGQGSSPTASYSPTSTGTALGSAAGNESASQQEPTQEHRYGQFTQAGGQNVSHDEATRGSGLSQEATTAQDSKHGSSNEPVTQGRDSGIMGKLKAAAGMGSNAGTEGVSRSDWSTSHNPTFDSDTPRSGVAGSTAFTGSQQQLTKRLSDAPPSASWGSSAQTASYAPAQTVSHGADPSTASGYRSDAHFQQGYTGVVAGHHGSAIGGSSSAALGSGAVTKDSSRASDGVSRGSAGYGNDTTQADTTTAVGRDSPMQGYVGSTASGHAGSGFGQSAPAGKESPVKGSTSAGQGTGLVSKDSPKAVSGIRGTTPVEQSSEAFSGDAASDSSAPQSSGQAQGPKEPLKLGTTVFEHATARNPGPASPTGINSPSAGAGLGTGIGAGAGQSGSIAGGPGTSAGQAAPPLVLGTTVFEHALSRTSGNPLGRTSGTPSSPRTSFKGPSAGATEPTSAGLQGGERTTSDLPVSTSAPPASARTTQDSPAQAGTAVGTTAGISKPSGQPSSIAEDNTSAKAAAQKAATGTPVEDGKKPAGPAGPQGATGTIGATGPTGATRPAPTAKHSDTAGRPNGAAKPSSKAKKGCFACFGNNSAQD